MTRRSNSRNNKARALKRWLTHEVIPTIRKRGFYATEELLELAIKNSELLEQTMQELRTERTKNRLLEAESTDNLPIMLFAKAV